MCLTGAVDREAGKHCSLCRSGAPAHTLTPAVDWGCPGSGGLGSSRERCCCRCIPASMKWHVALLTQAFISNCKHKQLQSHKHLPKLPQGQSVSLTTAAYLLYMLSPLLLMLPACYHQTGLGLLMH